MPSLSSEHADFATVFRDLLLDWSSRNEFKTVLALPPFQASGELHVVAGQKTLLKVKRGRKTSGHLISWPDECMHSKPNPFLVCVLEGSADLAVGVTEAIAKNLQAEKPSGVYQIRLREKDILIQPPHVPITDGTLPHWSAPDTPPDSTLLWIDVLSEGAILHTCHTVRGRHPSGPARFVFNARLLLVMEAIIEELQIRASVAPTSGISNDIVNSLVQLLFLRIYRSLAEQKSHEVIGAVAANIIDLGVLSATPDLALTSSGVVKRSCRFIKGRLGHSLSVQKIAEHVFVSPAQLNRLFRAQMKQSVMGYVNERRLDMAKELLINTSLPVKIISENVGIDNPVYFSRMFRQKTGMTPGEFRRLNR